MTLKVKYADFQIITRSKTTAAPIDTMGDLQAVSRSLLDPLFPTSKGIRLFGVTLSSFIDEETSGADQLELQI